MGQSTSTNERRNLQNAGTDVGMANTGAGVPASRSARLRPRVERFRRPERSKRLDAAGVFCRFQFPNILPQTKHRPVNIPIAPHSRSRR